MKAIFTSKIASGYNDNVELHYHFPSTYLRAVERAVGDAIIYYEPRRGGEMAYFGTAEVVRVRPDPVGGGLFYADLRNYLDFDRKVPFVENGNYYESALRGGDGAVNAGAFQRAVRSIPDDEFAAILSAGFSSPAEWPDPVLAGSDELSEPDQAAFVPERPMVMFTRAFRDRMFTRGVQRAYDRRCAVTGLRLLNGGGRPEVQAAHIQPVAASGPDSVRNGVALSGTMHWLFDRGMMTFEDNFTIRMAKGAVPEEIRTLVNPSGQLILPDSDQLRPSPLFLRYHREHVFKG